MERNAMCTPRTVTLTEAQTRETKTALRVYAMDAADHGYDERQETLERLLNRIRENERPSGGVTFDLTEEEAETLENGPLWAREFTLVEDDGDRRRSNVVARARKRIREA